MWINPELPYNAKLLREVVRKHLGMFLLLCSMGLIFSATGGTVIYFSQHWDGWLFGGVFLLAGLFMLAFAFVSNYSSVGYYYEKGLLKQHGKEVQAKITRKSQEDAAVRAYPDDPQSEVITERDCLIAFSYRFDGKDYENEAFISPQALFDWLSEGDMIAVRVLPQNPQISFPRLRKLNNLMKAGTGRKVSEKVSEYGASTNIRVSQSLMKED